MASLLPVQIALRALSSSTRAQVLQGFFKTGPGGYGEGDVFIGVTIPQIRTIVRRFHDLSEKDVETLVMSKIHEERMTGLLILVWQFQHTKDDLVRRRIYTVYLAYVKKGYVNNWDLVDATAYHIVGAYLHGSSYEFLERSARSSSLWERRVAIVSTFFFIQHKQSACTFKVARLLLDDKHDLIHKAVGWMLREVGKRCSEEELEGFLKPNYKKMPRTMLRYAIERFSDAKRREYLKGLI